MPKVSSNASNICTKHEFLQAVEKGNLEELQKLHYTDDQFQARDQKDNTPLHIASSYNHANVLKFLLQDRNLIDLESRNKDGDTPLHVAIKKNHVQAVALLLEQGADKEASDKDNDKPLYLSIERINYELVQLLLDRGAAVNSKNSKQSTSLHRAVSVRQSGEEIKIIQLLLQRGASLDALNEEGDTPLHCAVHFFSFYNDVRPIKLLLDAGSAIESRNLKGETPLHIAVKQDSLRITVEPPTKESSNTKVIHEMEVDDVDNLKTAVTRILLDYHANIMARDKQGNTPLHVVSDKRCELAKLLLKKGALIEALNDDGETPLQMAANQNKPELAKFLLENRANKEVRDKENKTLLHHAAQGGSVWLVNLLLDNKAEIDALDNQGKTPLVLATHNGKLDAMKALIERGADVSKVSLQSIIKISKWSFTLEKKFEVLTLLLAYKADINTVSLHKILSSNKWDMEAQFKLKLMEFLLSKGATVNELNEENDTLIYRLVSCYWRDKDNFTDSERLNLIRLLLDNGAATTYDRKVMKGEEENNDESKHSLLHQAIKAGDPAIVRLLIETGVPTDEIALSIVFSDREGVTAKQKLEIIRLLIEQGIGLNKNEVVHTSESEDDDETENNLLSEFIIRLIRGGRVINRRWQKEFKSDGFEREDRVLLLQSLLSKGIDIEAQTGQGEFALEVAVLTGDIEITQMLLDHGADFTRRTKSGATLLHCAVESRKIDMAKLLLEKGIPIDASIKKSADEREVVEDDAEDENLIEGVTTVLHNVVEQLDVDFVKFLVEQGASLECMDSRGNTALFMALKVCISNYREESEVNEEKRKKCEIIKYLIDKGSNILHRNTQGNTAVHAAIKERVDSEVIQFLLDKVTDINSQDKDGNTFLHLLVTSSNYQDIIELLLKRKADIHVKNKGENTCLHEAVDSGNFEMVKILVEHGAQLDTQNKQGDLPVHLALNQGRSIEFLEFLLKLAPDLAQSLDGEGNTLLHRVVLSNRRDFETIEYLSKEIPIERKGKYGMTVLHLAVSEKNLDIANYFIQKNANIHCTDQYGNTLLHTFTQLPGIIHKVKYGDKPENIDEKALLFFTNLLEKGLNINAKNKQGNTPLHLAALRQVVVLVKLLLDKGANPQLKNESGLTALEIASSYRPSQLMIDLLMPAKNSYSTIDSNQHAIKEKEQDSKNLYDSTYEVLINQNNELKQRINELEKQLQLERICRNMEPEQVVRMQASIRGFIARKKMSLQTLKQDRKKEVEQQLPEAMKNFAMKGQFDKIKSLVDAVEKKQFHKAWLLIQDKEEIIFQRNSKTIMY